MDDIDLGGLRDDHDVIALPDGRSVRLLIQPDESTTIGEDGDGYWYGKLESLGRSWRWGEHPPQRPDGFDGRARKLRSHHGDTFWWQPPDDVTDPDALHELRGQLVDILDHGYIGIVLELLDGMDAYSQPIVRQVASLWGVEPFPSREYVASVVQDLWRELDLTA